MVGPRTMPTTSVPLTLHQPATLAPAPPSPQVPGPRGRLKPATPRSACTPSLRLRPQSEGFHDARPHTHRPRSSARQDSRDRRTAGADHCNCTGSCRKTWAPMQVRWCRPQERDGQPLRRAVALKRRQLVLLKSLNLVPKSEQTNGARRLHARANRQAA